MPLSLRYSAHSEVGLVRKTNQDSGYVSPTMLIVADGMGGAAAGDLASTVAVRELKATDEALPRLLKDAERRRLTEPEDDDPVATDPEATAPDGVAGSSPRGTVLLGLLGSALARANDHLADLADEDSALDGMGTTVCGFVLADGRVAVVNIGDSRAYLLRDGQLRRVTRDHSWVQTLVDEGRITEAQALEHPHRSLILKVLNGNPQHHPDLAMLDIREGDRLVVCSDGLCGLVTDQQIAELVGDPDREVAIDELTALAHEAGGYDNITIIVADVVDGPPEGRPAVLGAARTMKVPHLGESTAPLPALEAAGPEAEDAAAAEASPSGAAGGATVSEEERYALRGRRGFGGWTKMLAAVLVPLLVLGLAGWGWYTYTQTQYYVGSDDDLVAVYRGVPDRILGRDLSHVVKTDTTRVGDLPPYYAERVRQNIKVENLAAADSTLSELRTKATRCVAQREARARAQTPPPIPSPSPSPVTASPSVSAGATLSPGATASASHAATASPTPSPTQTQVTTPEDC
ncbi:PP2C family protein-serine/threonine phosphatase [Nigerium massiliense]|uniref:PP2C family protein-serine/threonine phosphatase n=1 Tax=Nigerium massiliense TaxID=1522317 RepID=UPI000590889D|nr:protein phosphatase 2C domain-containing protein [Nigerium massiliense]